MPILTASAYQIPVPKMKAVHQIFPDEKIADIFQTLKNEMDKKPIASKIKPGMAIAVLVGSRGICDLHLVLKSTVDLIKNYGGVPFIVPAMGSHGGAVAEIQKEILESYGITEEFLGIPIRSSMETIEIGVTHSGIPIFVDKLASEADMVVPIARIKAHTDFNGSIESGLCKMLAIGMGKHNGCSRLHQEGFAAFPILIPEVGKFILEKINIGFGIALVENAHEHLHTIKAVPGSDFLLEEPKLLALSKSLMPQLFFPEIDVLIIEQIGKEISGAGLDPNMTGRMSIGPIPDFQGPKIKRIVVLGLSEKTHHNATGIGIADFITQKVYDSINLENTYANCIASGNPEAGKIPIMLPTENEAILAAIQTCGQIDSSKLKIVRIKDTLHLADIQVSESLMQYCTENNRFTVTD